MGDKDDLSMDEIMEQLKNLKDDYGNSYVPSSSNPSKIHVNPWDDPTLKPLYNQKPVTPSKEELEANEQAKKLVIQQGPTGSGKTNSIIGALEKAMREADEAHQKNNALGKYMKLPKGAGEDGEKTITITRTTDAGIKDLKQVRLDELCAFVNSDVDVDSTSGQFLIELYHGYQLMIKRIVERYPKGNFKNPADYFEKDIFDSIPELMDEDDAMEIIFELTGEDSLDGGIESIANLVFEGLNDRFLENSGWGDKESVTLIQNRNSVPASKGAARAIPPLSALKNLTGLGSYMPFDMSGSMNTPVSPKTQDEIDALIESIKKDADD